MIIVALADMHGNTGHLAAIAGGLGAADVVLLAGDLTNFGRAREAARIVDAVRQYNESVLAIPGNCDYPEVDAYLTQEGINLHRRSTLSGQVAFVGVGGSLPCPGKTPNEFSEEQLKAFLNQSRAGLPSAVPAVLLTHQPPFGTVVDRAGKGPHVGSYSIRDYIIDQQPLLCFTAHIHEGRGMDTLGATHIINPGPLNQGGYAYALIRQQRVEVVEIRG